MEQYPFGGRDSFIGALVVVAIVLIVTLWRVHKEEESTGKLIRRILEWLGDDIIVKGPLLFVTFIALWLAIRSVGYIGWLYLGEEEHRYTAFEVLDTLAFVLTINLCLTLLKSPRKREIVSATMQSVLIAILIFLPRATSTATLAIYGEYGGAALLVGLATLLMSLAYIIKTLPKNEKEKDDS